MNDSSSLFQVTPKEECESDASSVEIKTEYYYEEPLEEDIAKDQIDDEGGGGGRRIEQIFFQEPNTSDPSHTASEEQPKICQDASRTSEEGPKQFLDAIKHDAQPADEDEYDIFGRYVASTLRKMPVENALSVESQIFDVISQERRKILRANKLSL